MDALALLCNLYGDGPTTLKRLRSAGCDSFGTLEDLESDQLAEILGTNEAAARRFLREARLLVERVAEGDLEQEERALIVTAPDPAAPLRAKLAEPLAAATVDSAPAPRTFALPESRPPSGSARAGFGASPVQPGDRSTALIDRVLATWRERDACVGAGGRGVELGDPDELLEATESATDEGLDAPETPLRPRLVDGLDHNLCEQLLGAGFGTLEELSATDALVVAEASALELTRVLRLQFLARRVLSERGLVEGPPEPLAASQPAGHPWPLARSTPVQAAAAAPVAGESRPEVKFSESETPFGVATGQLAEDLERAGRRLRQSDSAAPDEGPGGPFA